MMGCQLMACCDCYTPFPESEIIFYRAGHPLCPYCGSEAVLPSVEALRKVAAGSHAADANVKSRGEAEGGTPCNPVSRA